MIITVAGCWSFDPSRFKMKNTVVRNPKRKTKSEFKFEWNLNFYQCYTFASRLPLDITLKSINYYYELFTRKSHTTFNAQSWEQFFQHCRFALINSSTISSKLMWATRPSFAYLNIHFIRLNTTFTPYDTLWFFFFFFLPNKIITCFLLYKAAIKLSPNRTDSRDGT